MRLSFPPFAFLVPSLGLVVILLAATSPAQQPAKHQYQRAALIRLEGTITPLMEQFLDRKLVAAEESGVDLILLEIDSPGGFTITTMNITDRLRAIEWAEIVAYVPRQAISGAAIITLASDQLIAGPEARIGDAGEIMLDKDNMFQYVPEKQRSVLVRHVRDLATATGRPPALAEAMVDMDLVVYRVQHVETGQVTFKSQAELDALPQPAEWQRFEPVLESREKQFLTVNGERAVELQLASQTVGSTAELLELYPAANVVVLEYTTVDSAVFLLNLPIVTGLLFVIGLVALYVEFSAPGLGAGGLVAGLCFTLFFWSRFLGGTAGWLEVILFAAGVIFIAMEFFVIPGFGIAGLGGLTLVVISVLMASQHFLIPSTDLEYANTLASLKVIVASGTIFLIAAFGISRYLGSIPGLSRLALQPPTASPTDTDETKGKGSSLSQDRFPVQVGDWGQAESPLRPAGKAIFGEAYVDVVSDGAFIEPGQQVRVIDVSGNRVLVRQVEDA